MQSHVVSSSRTTTHLNHALSEGHNKSKLGDLVRPRLEQIFLREMLYLVAGSSFYDGLSRTRLLLQRPALGPILPLTKFASTALLTAVPDALE